MSYPIASPVWQTAKHIGESSGSSRGLSPHLWANLQSATTSPDGSGGEVWFDDDFMLAQGITETAGDLTYPGATGLNADGYKCWVATGGKIERQPDVTGGVLRVESDNVDNDTAGIGTGDLVQLSDTAADAKFTIFECNIAIPAVTGGSVFIGLGSDELLVDDGLVDNTGAIITTGGSGMGFSILDASPTEIDFVYKAAGQAHTVKIDALQTAVAGTFYRLGWCYNPYAPVTQRVKIYLDDVEQTTYVTATNIAAATFPDAEYMGLIAMTKADSTTASNIDIDRWTLFQEG